jgi:hypothetical protein
MPPKKQVVDLPVIGVIDLNDEVPMKTKKPKKVKEVIETVVEMPLVKTTKKTKKPRKVKSTDSEEEEELNRHYETPMKEEKEVKPKAGNAWIAHIKAFALENGITYNKAMLDPRLKETYVKSTKGKVSLG